MRNLSREAFDHDDPNSRRHGKDKREKGERDAVDFVPVPSPLRAGGKELTGVDFDADSAGFMFAFGNHNENTSAALGVTPLPSAARVDPAEYRKRILREEKERRRFRRTITKNGKEVETWGSHKCGALSLVVTVPPWCMSVINALEDDHRDALLLRVADAAARRMEEVSDRVPWGGGCHLDTDIAHFHFQVPKTSPAGENWAKSKFKTGGPWLVGADRVERQFPGLLSAKQKELMESHKKRKGQMVDLEIAAAVDKHLESEFRRLGLEKNYEESCREYVRRKKRAQETDQSRRLLRESLRYFVVEGIWPLAASSMKLAMWRMVPPEIRPLVFNSVRATQVLASPVKAAVVQSIKYIAEKLKEDAFPEPEPVPPMGRF
ncbi:MAG: hypothetical protein ACOYM3_15175 [Terrimicrobiaceae bacterium]